MFCDHENWFIAARSDQLTVKPLGRTILDHPIVLFRNSNDEAVALQDRCSHKSVALSLGRVNGDRIECPYHGLCFDSGGQCVLQPARAPEEPLLDKRIPSYLTLEQDNWIWVYMGSAKSPSPPPRYKKESGYGWFELHNVMTATMDLILDNGLDCSHTGIVHRGLFRSSPSQLVRACIEETADGFRVETIGERASGKFDLTAFATGGAPIEHTETFIRPHTIQVDYKIRKAHFITILVCTPESHNRTRVYTRQGIRMPPLTPLATLLSRFHVRRIVAQDKQILENQAAQLALWGQKMNISTNADAPTRWLYRELKSHREFSADSPRSEEVEYKL